MPITLTEAREAQKTGRRVLYTGRNRQDTTELPDCGTITSVNDTYVFVRYDMSPTQSQATRPIDLIFEY